MVPATLQGPIWKGGKVGLFLILPYWDTNPNPSLHIDQIA